MGSTIQKLIPLFILSNLNIENSLLILRIVFIYNNNGTNSLIQMNNINNFDKIILIFLGGLPPFLGFLSKVLVLKLTIYIFNYIFLLIMIYTSLIILYCYISRFFFLLTYSPKIKFDTKNFYSSKKKIIFLITIYFLI